MGFTGGSHGGMNSAHTAKGFVADLADFVFADFGLLACHVNG